MQTENTAQAMSSDLVPNDQEQSDPTSSEVHFALVITRMLDTVQDDPEQMRQAVYDLARYKLQEQFTHDDAKDIRRAQQALETAIDGVEQFARQQIPLPRPTQQLGHESARSHLPFGDVVAAQPVSRFGRQTIAVLRGQRLLPLIARTAATLLVVGGVLLAVQMREPLWSLAQDLRGRKVAISQPAVATVTPVQQTVAALPPVPKPNPLRPTDYGVYAITDDHLVELPLLPGRAPDGRIAVSAPLKVPGQTTLSNGHPKFIVFRRDAASNAADRTEVRIVAKVAREFTSDAAGKKPDDNDATWVIRNMSFALRSSPVQDSPEMYELHSEEPALELTPGRYALILRGQAYDFTVPGKITDPRQCIERVMLTTGMLYTDCKKL